MKFFDAEFPTGAYISPMHNDNMIHIETGVRYGGNRVHNKLHVNLSLDDTEAFANRLLKMIHTRRAVR